MRLKNTFSKFLRIRKKWEFSQLRERGAHFSGSTCRFRYLEAPPEKLVLAPKLGITISKKYGNAVKRNEFKRWTREAFRTKVHLMPKGMRINVSVASWAKEINQIKINDDFDTFIHQMNKRNLSKTSP